jgi:hypothetical protein
LIAFRRGVRYRWHQRRLPRASVVATGLAPERHQAEQMQPEVKVGTARPPVDLVHTLHHGSE